MANKMTHKDFYNAILTKYALTESEKEFIKGRIEALDKKKATASGKATVKQTENDVLKTKIYNEMEEGKRYTITEMIKELSSCENLTNQKVSSLVRSLKEEHLVERIEEKGKAYFSKIEADED